MTDTLNRWDLLDPTRGLRDTDAALGGGVFDIWSDLDPSLAAARINAKRSGTIDNASLLDPYRALQRINASGGGYAAKAVHFDGASTLMRSAGLIAPDSYYGIVSMWSRGTFAGYNDCAVMGCQSAIDGPTTFTGPLVGWGTGYPDWANANASADASSYETMHFNNNLIENVWHHWLIAWDLNHDQGARLYAMYVDDVQVPVNHGVQHGPAYKTNNSASGEPTNQVFIMCAGDVEINTADYADPQYYVEHNIVQPDGSILAADRRNFISDSKKPVDPATAVAAYGSPACLFSGDHTSFATNRGTGGAFALTGTLTDASTSPSD